MAGQLIANRYQVKEEIGAGGMGTVYKGVDTQTGEMVAVKQLKPEATTRDTGLLERFTREAEALRDLNHPNIVRVLDTIEESDNHYIVMEYVSGGSLDDTLLKFGRLPVSRVLELALDLADALTRAHRLHIVHRDLKPANVLLAKDGTPRLTDFGVAHIGTKGRVTQTGAIIGTPDYMSPETLNGDMADPRDDIWAFGVLIFEMLTGQRPFPGEMVGQVVTSILTQEPPDLETLRPDAPTALIDLVYRMLVKNRDARIPSVRLVGAELEALLRGEAATTSAVYAARQVVEAPSSRFKTTPSPATQPKRNIPAQVTPFIGREDELQSLTRLLSDPGVRLVSIVGVGGMGKTRLSIAAAELQASNFRDGVFFVPLAPLDNDSYIVSTIAERIGFTFGGGDQRMELLNYLREKELLLVLDNFEHLITGVTIVSDILQTAPAVKLLVTSRERLRLQSEHIFDIDGMAVPQETTSEAIQRYASVQLFAQSARRILADFNINDENAACVARISHLVQGMPLGLELAAGWLESLTIKEIAEEIEHNLDFLETDLRDVPERHRSLRSVFDYSWNLLDSAERDLFMKLAVFRGGFEREAAQKITGAGLRTLNALVNKSLLRRDPAGRYTVHMLVRQYAEEAFNQKYLDVNAVRDAHADYYATLMQQLESTFNTSKEQSAIKAVEIELENVRVAMTYAIAERRWETLDKIVQSLLLYDLSKSLLREGLMAFSMIVDALDSAGETTHPLYARARLRQAWITGRLGNYTTAWDYASRAFAYFKVHKNTVEMAYTLNQMSYARMMQGKYDDSREYAQKAGEMAQAAANESEWFTAEANRGYVEFLAGNYTEARRTYENITFKLPPDKIDQLSPVSLGFGYNNLGEILLALNELKGAQPLFEKAYDIFESYRHRRGMAFSINNLAGVHFRRNNHQEARRFFQESHDLYRQIGDRSGLAHALSALGNVAFHEQNHTQARVYYQQSLAIRSESGDLRGKADSLADLCLVAFMQDDFAEGCRLAQESLDIRRQIGDRNGTVFSLSILGIASWELGDKPRARTLFDEAYTLSTELEHPWLIAQTLFGLGNVRTHDGDFEQARADFQRIIRYGLEQDVPGAVVKGLMGFASLHAAQGDPVRALELVSLVQQQPFNTMNALALGYGKKLYNQLSNQLEPEVARAAEMRGRALNLDTVVEELLAA